MARKTTAQLKTGRDFGDLLDSIHNNSDVQRITATGAFTVSRDTSFVALAADGGKTVTMPAAIKGRKLRFFWEVEQATNDLVATCQGSDVFAGNIFTSVEGNGAGDGDVVAIANTTVAITFVDDVNIGSYVDFQCAADGTWLVSGHLVIDGVANVPTLA
tara:strand:- start:300 stop:776 length:477 start_codon:yes stop_codon:yes gene_type:complete